MVLLEDKHGAQANGSNTAATDVNTDGLGLGDKLVTLGSVPGNEGTLALTTQVLEVPGVLLSQALETGVQVVTGDASVLNETQALDLLDDTAVDQGAGGVTHPGVELAVRLVGAQGRVAIVVTGSLSLLGEGNHVRGSLQVPVVVGPELSGGTDTGLHLVDDEEHVGALGDLAQTLEESGRGVVVATLGLDGLNHDSSDGVVELLDEALNLIKAALLLGGVLMDVFLQRVLQGREGSLGPVKGGDIDLVDSLAAGGRQGAEETAMEGRLEGEDRELGRAGNLVVHGRQQLLLGELNLVTTTLHLAVVHEGGLVGSLVGIRASHGSEDLVQALGGSLEGTGLQDVGPVSRGEVTQSRTVNQGIEHLRRLRNLLQVGVVVADGDGGDLSIHIQQLVAIEVGNVVTDRPGVVGKHVQAAHIEHLIELRGSRLVLGPGDGRLNGWSGRLIGEEGLLGRTQAGGG